MIQLHYDKDEFKLIAKRGKGATFTKKTPTKNNVAYSKTKAKHNPYSNPKNSHHIVTKITGGATDSKKVKAHFDYISRNGETPIFNEYGEQIDRKLATNEVNADISKTKWHKNNQKQTYQIMFSRKGHTDPEVLKNVVRETMLNQFPEHKFFYAVHEDTENTHVHVVVEKCDKTYLKKLDLNKKKLNNLKSAYAKTLNKYGFTADYFISETQRKAIREQYLGQYDKQKEQSEKRSELRKNANKYIVLDFGKAPYKMQEGGKSSYYILVQTKNGKEKVHWSLGLKDEIERKGVNKGDYIILKKTGELPKEGGFSKSNWEIEILNNAKKNQEIPQEFIITDFGKAPYKFEERGKPSYYVLLQNQMGKVKDIWGISYQTIISQNNLKKGDKVKFSESDKGLVKSAEVTQKQVEIKSKISNIGV